MFTLLNLLCNNFCKSFPTHQLFKFWSSRKQLFDKQESLFLLALTTIFGSSTHCTAEKNQTTPAQRAEMLWPHNDTLPRMVEIVTLLLLNLIGLTGPSLPHSVGELQECSIHRNRMWQSYVPMSHYTYTLIRRHSEASGNVVISSEVVCNASSSWRRINMAKLTLLLTRK